MLDDMWQVRSGIIVMDTDCVSRTAKSKRRFFMWVAHIGISKHCIKYAPFYRTRKFIGAKHGTAFEAYFAFSYTLIRLNFFIASLWFVLIVLPQFMLMSDPPPDIVADLVSTFGLRDLAAAAQQAAALAAEQGVDGTPAVNLDVLENLIESGNSTAFRPGVFLFSGYLPRFSLTRLSDLGGGAFSSSAGGSYWLDFCYVSCPSIITMFNHLSLAPFPCPVPCLHRLVATGVLAVLTRRVTCACLMTRGR